MDDSRKKVNERIEKGVMEQLHALKQEWRAKNVSQVIERLCLEYKYKSKK